MEDSSSTSSNANELDHPEVLSRQRLTEILCERSIHPHVLVDLDKGELVQLFKKHVTPLPQRLHQLRRVKRVTSFGKESETSKGKTSTIKRSTKRKSEETVDATASKLTRTEHRNIIKINKKPASLESINRVINTVSIDATSPTLDSAPGHENNTLNETTKPKAVKLNRKTLGLNLNKSAEQATLMEEFLGLKKSEETVDATASKLARTEHRNIIKINKKPASLESINRVINTVSINATSTLDSAPGHENNTLNKTTKPKVVKLNRKTLGLNLNKSAEQATLMEELGSSVNGGSQKEVTTASTSSESGSDDKESNINHGKKKFEKVTVTWP